MSTRNRYGVGGKRAVPGSTSCPVSLMEGRPVTVLYDPADPASAQVASDGATALGVAFIAIGGVCVVIGAALIAAGTALEDALPDEPGDA